MVYDVVSVINDEMRDRSSRRCVTRRGSVDACVFIIANGNKNNASTWLPT